MRQGSTAGYTGNKASRQKYNNIMGGLVTASAGTVKAGNVAIYYDKQQLFVTLKLEEKEGYASSVQTTLKSGYTLKGI